MLPMLFFKFVFTDLFGYFFIFYPWLLASIFVCDCYRILDERLLGFYRLDFWDFFVCLFLDRVL